MSKNKKSQKIKNFGKPKKEQKVETVKTPPATKPATSAAKAPPVTSTPKVAPPPVIARKPAAPPVSASENAIIGHLVDIKFSSGNYGARQYYKWLVNDRCILQKINLDNTLEIGDCVEVTLGTHNGNPSVENTHKVVEGKRIEQLVGIKKLPEIEPESGDTVVYPNELASAILRNSKVFKPKIKGWVGSQLVYS